MSARGLIVAAPRSGSGKTTVTLALLAALRRRGVAVSAGKSGPDYIDPGFHAAATGHPGTNLDSWAMPPPLLDRLAHATAGDGLLLIESAMGLFDGIGGADGRRGRAADLAARFGLPVVLVLDVSGQSQSAAAVARGFASHEAGVRVGGVILNRVGSDRHFAQAADAIVESGLPVLGRMRRDPALALPERHLGLVQASEQDLHAFIGRLADLAEQDFDVDAIEALAGPLAGPLPGEVPPCGVSLPPPGQRVAVAQDAAFTFLYPHLLRDWREQGAEIVPFSPLAGQGPDASCDSCWLPGGYPELHAPALAAATTCWDALRRFADRHPVHGECGGYMVLGEALIDAGGVAHRMAGLLGHVTSYAKRRMHLGYREATLLADGVLGARGTVLRGHEFHYASVADPGPDAPFAALRDGTGATLPDAGGRRGMVSGTFFHAIARQPG